MIEKAAALAQTGWPGRHVSWRTQYSTLNMTVVARPFDSEMGCGVTTYF
jgi:hypothetical protein